MLEVENPNQKAIKYMMSIAIQFATGTEERRILIFDTFPSAILLISFITSIFSKFDQADQGFLQRTISHLFDMATWSKLILLIVSTQTEGAENIQLDKCAHHGNQWQCLLYV